MRRRGWLVPALGPVRQWQQEWVDTGVCAEAPTRQLLLPLQPPAEIVEAAANGSPSPRLTVPPGAQYHSNVIVYLEPAHVPSRNGVVRPVYGYTAVRMEGPVWPILVDAFGAPPGARATPIRQAPPPDIGLVTAGVLGFVDAARRIIREGWAPPDGNTAVMVYAPREIMKYIAGVWNPHHPALTAAAVEARIALQKLQVSRPVFFREAPTDIQHQTFRDRALSLAWRTPRAPPGMNEDRCPVCLDEYGRDKLPDPGKTGEDTNPAPPGAFRCMHFLCQDCTGLERSPGEYMIPACPTCRAQRR